MKIHVLCPPHSETTSEWSACAYTQRTMDFASMMHDIGYEVHLYGGDRNEARVTEHVPIVSRSQQKAWWPDIDRTKVFNDFNANSLPWRVYNGKAMNAIRARCDKGDILAVTLGTSHQPAAVELPDLLHVETGIGYAGVWAPYRVFESLAWRHYMAGKDATDSLRWFDEVIPRGYFASQFTDGSGGQDYLFMGRLTQRKGPEIAADVCKQLGSKLLVAGQGVEAYKSGEFIRTTEGFTLTGNVHYLGVLSPKERAIALSSVRAVFMPTWYLEPGGGVAIEAQMCGTPVITTPWGAMTETVIPGVTGYHCTTFSEFVHAAHDVARLDRFNIRIQAIARFSSDVIAKRYDAYFKKLQTLYDKGWYQL